MRLVLAVLLLTISARGQWLVQASGTTAELRGIHSLGNGVAWASGSRGTVLRTTDNGTTWKVCAVPAGAEALDFRGVQAYDATTALVMSSGKGDLSRLYKTTDGCKSWKLVFTNPDAEGFWDALQVDYASDDTPGVHNRCFGVIVGDPVDGFFPMFLTFDCGGKWERQLRHTPAAGAGEGLFAASNEALLIEGVRTRSFVTGSATPRVIRFDYSANDTGQSDEAPPNVAPGAMAFTFQTGLWTVTALPGKGKPSPGAGAFAIANHNYRTVIVGGDYALPDKRENTAWYSDGGDWRASNTAPQGYRSAVQYSQALKSWITVGPNGTEVSTDDGRNWRPLNASAEESQHWNALSLPFVVGPHGRIGLLRAEALKR